MNRREFSQTVALGAGSLGVWSGAADQTAAVESAAAAEAPPRPLEPVTVGDYQALAKAVLPEATYDYITSGSTDEVTLRDNVAAFQRIRLLPPLLSGVDQVDTATTVLGQKIALPVLLAPAAAQNLYHPDGVLAAARAAAAAQTILGVSSSAGHTVEEVAAAGTGPKWFQLYVPKDRGVGRQMVERVNRAGYRAIIVTVDLGERKDADLRHRFALPDDMLRSHLRGVGFEIPDRMTADEVAAFNAKAWDQSFTWKIFDWLRPLTKLPLIIKGVLRAEDARQAVSLGLNGIVVSNHGGRRLDGVPASIDRLAHIVDAVDGKAEVLLDSGVRRGTDVFKALALGAKAVLIGRPYIWALAADGETGVRNVLRLLHEELVSAMHASGCADVASIQSDLLLR